MNGKSRLKLSVTRDSITVPLVLLAVFYGVAAWRFAATGKVFYLWNFGYIGTSLAMGTFFFSALPRKLARWGRVITEIAIGGYLLFYVGLAMRENMQIEGFFVYLFSGVFAGATLHYAVGKVFGPFAFGRGWCGWACWTAMALDILPWKIPSSPPRAGFSQVRYIHFALVLAAMVALTLTVGIDGLYARKGADEVRWLLVGNAAYYATAIALAAALRDNRAFCKYLCPVACLLKVGTRFSLLRVEIDESSCVGCGACERACPMGVPLLEYARRGERVSSTECVLCFECERVCPRDAVKVGFRPGRRVKKAARGSRGDT